MIELDQITDVDYLDSDPINSEYHFMLTMEGQRVWKLKTTSEVRSDVHCCVFFSALVHIESDVELLQSD